MEQNKKKASNFLAQGSILAVSGIIVRVIGLIYQIPVINIIGDQGNGYYSVAFDIYNVALILSSYSLPLAVSKLMAARNVKKEYRESYRIFVCALAFAIVSGLLMAAIIYFGANFLAVRIFNMQGVSIPLKVLSPCIFVCAVLGVFRGLYQGRQTMIPTAISQVIEQLVNAVVSIVAAKILMTKYASDINAPAYGAAGSTLGTTCGAIAGLLFVLLVYIMYRPTMMRQISRESRRKGGVVEEESYGYILKLLIWTILPIILSQCIYQVSTVIDSSMFNHIMSKKGMDEDTRSALLGISSKYRTLINVPIAISQAIATSMVPSIVAATVRGGADDVRAKVHAAVKFNMLIAIPSSVGMGVLAKPILMTLFPRSTTTAFQALAAGSVAIVFYALSTVTTGALHGISKMRIPVIHSAISLAIHLVLVYVLLKFTNFGLFALVIGNITFPLAMVILNWKAVHDALDYHQELINTFIKPAAASLVMGIAAKLVFLLFFRIYPSYAVATVLAVCAGVVVYALMLLLLGALTEEELHRLPMSGRLIAIQRRCSRLMHRSS